jgi:hypothetical protein
MPNNHILPVPRSPFWYQGASYFLQHITGAESPLPCLKQNFDRHFTDDKKNYVKIIGREGE